MNVEWKEINPDYIISSDGKVMSRKWGKLRALKPMLVGKGYLQVKIYGDGGSRLRPVHQLVAEAFLGPKPTPAHQVNHKNGVKTDNCDHNLEYVTSRENVRHSLDSLGKTRAHGENVGSAKLTEADVREIRALCAAGTPQPEIAAAYGITQANVSSIICHKSWGWLK